MSEFKVGDKVWVLCEVSNNPGDGTYEVKNDCFDEGFWVVKQLCKPVEPEAVVKQPLKTEPETKQSTTTDTHYEPGISRVRFEFTQSPNTLGTTSMYGDSPKDLIVECEYQLPGEEPFFVIRSTSGWSFDQPETLLALLNSVKDAEKKCRCSLPQS